MAGIVPVPTPKNQATAVSPAAGPPTAAQPPGVPVPTPKQAPAVPPLEDDDDDEEYPDDLSRYAAEEREQYRLTTIGPWDPNSRPSELYASIGLVSTTAPPSSAIPTSRKTFGLQVDLIAHRRLTIQKHCRFFCTRFRDIAAHNSRLITR